MMPDLTTNYLGLKLRNPIVVSSSPLQRDLDNIRRMEDAGASAVVMHSLFEEQITRESSELNRWLEHCTESYAESLSFLPNLDTYNLGPDRYMEHLAQAKRSVGIPIIGSLNGTSLGSWIRYARLMEEAGADAIELNTYFLPTRVDVPGSQIEQMYCELVKEIQGTVKIPLAVKTSQFFSSIPNMMKMLDEAGASGLVLFNRFYQPDLDLYVLEVVPGVTLSQPQEVLLRLHWVAVLYGHVEADLAISGGVHGAAEVIKAMMVGAQVSMMTSALLQRGIGHIRQVLADVQSWMETNEYESIQQMQGSMSMRSVPDPGAFERVNYMRVLSSYALRDAAR